MWYVKDWGRLSDIRSRKNRQLLNVKYLDKISMYLTSSQKEHSVEPQSLKEAKKTPERDHCIKVTKAEVQKLEKRCCWKVTREPKKEKVIN